MSKGLLIRRKDNANPQIGDKKEKEYYTGGVGSIDAACSIYRCSMTDI
jgi:hypothetical protein